MPSIAPIAPLLTPESNRFKRPWKDGSRSMRVPVWTPDAKGQEFDGLARIPARLCHTAEHTNERLEFNRLIRGNIERWVGWRQQRGWEIASTPKVRGPFDPPQSDEAKSKRFTDRATKVIGKSAGVRSIVTFDHSEDLMWYFIRARFKRTAPMFIRLDDILEMRDMGQKYGVDLNADVSPENDLGRGAKYLEVDGGEDPMVVAAERRARLGLNRADYLMGDLRDPL